MNYRHAYHAGNFADVLKHAVLARVIEHLKQKPAAFRVIDTHAGAGVYDLSGEKAQKTGEWRDGIGRLVGADLPPAVAALLAPYLGVVCELNPSGPITRYPGSPLIARRLIRRADHLIANELQAEERAALEALFARDRQAKVMGLDGFMALKALLPPKERRGVVIVDPPFEQPGEFERLVQGLRDGARRFATGIVMLWYPIKDLRPVSAFHRALADVGAAKLMSAELMMRPPDDARRLNGCGLVLLNPPFTLEADLALLLPFLAARLGHGTGATHRLQWLQRERITSS